MNRVYSLFPILLFAIMLSCKVNAELSRPEAVGVLHSVGHYSKLIEQHTPPVPAPYLSLVQACNEELKLRQKQFIKYDDVAHPCNNQDSVGTGPLDHAVSSKNGTLVIEKTIKVYFYFKKRHRDDALKANIKNMFYSAVNCMTALYKRYDINLNLKLVEMERERRANLTVFAYDSYTPAYASVPIGNYDGEASDTENCQIVSHVLSHQLGLPDRSQIFVNNGDLCDLQRIYPSDTLMALHGEKGFAGFNAFRLHEHDLQDLLVTSCPTSITHYRKHLSFASIDDYSFIQKAIDKEARERKKLSTKFTQWYNDTFEEKPDKKILGEEHLIEPEGNIIVTVVNTLSKIIGFILIVSFISFIINAVASNKRE